MRDGDEKSGMLGGFPDELRDLFARTREVVLLAAVVGMIVGLAVVAFERLATEELFEVILAAPAWVQVLAPGVGLATAAVLLRYGGRGGHRGTGTTPATADEFIKAVPDPDQPFDLRLLPARVLASLATLGSGGALGYEGPSIYIGAGVGVGVWRRMGRLVRGVDRRAALVAGAAAGVAAIFKAPATGAVFALEVPFQEDLARRSLLPALVGAASGYTVFVAINGTDALIPVSGSPDLALTDLAAAALVGIACGIGARVFALVVRSVKDFRARYPTWWRVPVAAVALGGLVLLSRAAFDGEALSLGAGYDAIFWSLDPDRALGLIALLGTARVAAVALTLGGGGAGGLFVPLVVQGAITGRFIGGVVGAENETLFLVLGIAAFLGAGYRVPLAAIMFVAEATGQPGFIVPGLIAAVVAQLLMGESSVSRYQQRRRVGHMEQRANLPVTRALSTDPATTVPEISLAEFFTEHVALAHRRAVPVVTSQRYVGMVVVDDVLDIDRERWFELTVAGVMRTDVPTGEPDWSLGQALGAMIDGDVEHLPIVDEDGELRGVVTSQAVLDLDRLMGRIGEERPANGDSHDGPGSLGGA